MTFDEVKHLMVEAINIAESTMPPFVGVAPGQQALCKALDAIEDLATSIRQAALEEAFVHLMRFHIAANGRHNYFHFAANEIRALAGKEPQQ